MTDVEPGVFIPLWLIFKTVQVLSLAGAGWLGWFLRGRHERRPRAPKLVEPDTKVTAMVRA